MGTQRLSKTNRLLWLGRYVERVIISVGYVNEVYDRALDGIEFDCGRFCEQLEIPCDYHSTWDFVEHYLTDGTISYSIASSMNFAFDNGVVLHETISSEALSYLQMSKNIMDNIAVNAAPMLDLQTVSDYLLAFKGCVDESITRDGSRMVMKVGFSTERIDLMLRLGYRLENLDGELSRLTSRLERSSIDRDGNYLRLLLGLAPAAHNPENQKLLIECLEHLFPDA